VDNSFRPWGEVIKAHREAMGLTQKELGDAAGYGKGADVAISRIESGQTRPRRERLEAIAKRLGLSLKDLDEHALAQTGPGATSYRTGLPLSEARLAGGVAGSAGAGLASGRKSELSQRASLIEQEIVRRESALKEATKAFNGAHDRAQAQYLATFIDVSQRLVDAPTWPDLSGEVQARGWARAMQSAAGAIEDDRFLFDLLKGMTASQSSAAGDAVDSGLLAAGLAPGLSAVSRALGSRAGASGSNSLGLGSVVGPALLVSLGVLALRSRQDRRKHQELSEKYAYIESELDGSREVFDAVVDLLRRVTETLEYIAVHGGHALARWRGRLPDGPLHWNSLEESDRAAYGGFVTVTACQLTLISINVDGLLESRGAERVSRIAAADEVLSQVQETVSLHV
jgi:transcriptional regulator with XRE-family HTH domain